MLLYLQYALAFIVAIGLIVTIHEYGHFIIARAMGVKVLRFSVGFGRPLWMHTAKQSGTQYVIAAIPLGGYVKMVDEREDQVASADLPYAFNRKPLWRRAAIVAAGPIFNFIFAVIAYSMMFGVGVEGMVPRIGAVVEDSVAQRAGLQSSDVIESVNDRSVATWEQTGILLLDEAIENGIVEIIARAENGNLRVATLDLSDTRALLDEGYLFDKIGIEPWSLVHLAPVIGEVVENEPARQAGLQAGDQVIAVNGENIQTWKQWVDRIRNHPEEVLQLSVRRNGHVIPVSLQPRVKTEGDLRFGYIGAAPLVDEEWLNSQRVTVQYGLVDSISAAIGKTAEMTGLTMQILGRLVMGEASLKNVSGPISIAEYAGKSLALGIAQYLSMLAIISISIGILNLLPIPMLDGGHLFYYLVEAVTGRPVSETVMGIGQRVGIFVLVSLMGLAFYNDITRIFG